MATGGASQVAGSAGLHVLTMPLLWLAAAQAAVIAAVAIARRARRRWVRTGGLPGFGFGDLTVPIGLAVLGIGIAGVGGRLSSIVAGVLAGGAWAATAVLLPAAVVAGCRRRPGLAGVDGTWFLAPAALLVDAVVAAALPHHPAAPTSHVVEALVFAGCLLGFLGYPLVLGLAAARVAHAGLTAAPRVSWWISAGCGGLAAAALGHARPTVADLTGGGWVGPATLAVWSAGSLLLVPVLAGSLGHLLRPRRIRGIACWPPTFSTAVYALGTSAVPTLTNSPAIALLGRIAAYATVALWLATVAIYILSRVRAGWAGFPYAVAQCIEQPPGASLTIGPVGPELVEEDAMFGVREPSAVIDRLELSNEATDVDM